MPGYHFCRSSQNCQPKRYFCLEIYKSVQSCGFSMRGSCPSRYGCVPEPYSKHAECFAGSHLWWAKSRTAPRLFKSDCLDQTSHFHPDLVAESPGSSISLPGALNKSQHEPCHLSKQEESATPYSHPTQKIRTNLIEVKSGSLWTDVLRAIVNSIKISS